MKKTKIVCTLGPASSSPETLRQMARAGMDVVRLNFSHGTHEEHRERIRLVRQISREIGKEIGILVDLQGPKIRTGRLEKPLLLEEGNRLYLVPAGTSFLPAEEDLPAVTVDYPYIASDLKEGNTVFMRDGLIQLRVEKVLREAVCCRVLKGGELNSRQGVTLPGVSLNLPAVTEKDLADLEFALKEEVDFIALSFVRRAGHVDEVRRIIVQAGSEARIIAKIENEEGFKRRGEILAAADGLMVARGDLGIEVPPEEVPLMQKTLIKLANRLGKPVITATEMLESMVRNPRPTRAEVTDVAYAIISGTDAVMLSAETATGRYPVQAVKMMTRIASKIEPSLDYEEQLRLASDRRKKPFGVADAISHATCQIAFDLGARAIITCTQSGSTARMVAKYRPQAPVLAPTPSIHVARALTLSWGVIPMQVPMTTTTDATLDAGIQAAVNSGLVKRGDLVVITGGLRTGIPGTTNLLQVHEINGETGGKPGEKESWEK